jgi:hypothetical protein
MIGFETIKVKVVIVIRVKPARLGLLSLHSVIFVHNDVILLPVLWG